MKILKLAITLLILIAVTGCAGYTLVEPGSTKIGDFNVETGNQWTSRSAGGNTYWTRDGDLLNQVSLEIVKNGKHILGLPSKDENKAFHYQSGMVLEEVVEQYIDSLTASGKFNVNLVSDLPTAVDSLPAVDFHFTYDTENGLKYEAVAKFIQKDGSLYKLICSAPQEHYFPAFNDDFRKILQTAGF